MSGSFGELGSLLKQAQQMQRELDRARAELKERTVEGVAAGGAVRVLVTGDLQVDRVELLPELVAEGDRQRIEELVTAAVRDGLERAHKLRDETLGKVTGGIELPGTL